MAIVDSNVVQSDEVRALRLFARSGGEAASPQTLPPNESSGEFCYSYYLIH
jgi:hypothetical protein